MIIKHQDINGNIAVTIAAKNVSYTIEKINEHEDKKSYVVKMDSMPLTKPILLDEAEDIIKIIYNAILAKNGACDLIEWSPTPPIEWSTT